MSQFGIWVPPIILGLVVNKRSERRTESSDGILVYTQFYVIIYSFLHLQWQIK